MNDDTIQDLKQFIAATISQQTADLATKEDIAKLEDKISNLDIGLSSKIDEISNSVAEALEVSNEDTDEQLKNHNIRISKLEQKTA